MDKEKKILRTTFNKEFLDILRVEAAKRDIYMNELIEIAVIEYLKEEKNNEQD